MADSLQKWVGRNRPPRVQITYDVEIGDAIEKKELPMTNLGMQLLSQEEQELVVFLVFKELAVFLIFLMTFLVNLLGEEVGRRELVIEDLI